MSGSHDNVIKHPAWADAGREQLARLEVLRATVGQLDELGCRLQQVSPNSSWPAQRWMIASTPFRMRLIGVRQGLGELARMDHIAGRDAVRWALKLNDARLQAERRLHDLDVCLHTLQRVDVSPRERVRETEVFASSRSELLKTLQEIRHLIARRFPAVVGES
jgi:hypothetical protein